jgi:hypothetical protein
MSALYGPESVNLPHVNIFKWAQEKNVFLPLDFRGTPEVHEIFLKYLANRPNFVTLPPHIEKARFSAALKEAIQYLPSNGLSDRTIMIFQIAGIIFLAVLCQVGGANAKL